MPKLCQLVAVVAGQKTDAEKVITAAHNHRLKSDLITGLDRTYKPLDDEGERLPAESKKVQATVQEVLSEVRTTLEKLYDAILTTDIGNTHAKADIEANGVVVLKDIPVTTMLYLEKQATDLGTFIEKLPVLDTSESWEKDQNTGGFMTKPYETLKTGKTYKTHVAYEATDKHPAQVQTFAVDVTIGRWTNVKRSGAIPVQEKNAMLARIKAFKEGIKSAREQANTIEVKQQSMGKAVFDFILEGKSTSK